MPSANHEPLGIIAGNRSLPLILAREARAAGVTPLVAVAFENETDPSLGGLVDELVWLKVGQLSRLIKVFKERSVRRCVMVGQIAPKNLFQLRPDLRAVNLLLRLKEKNAQTIFGAIAAELQKEGIELIEPLPWLRSCLAVSPLQLGPSISSADREDLQFGFKIAKEISRLEIGQTVVVKEGTVLAVEGFEGTDACLARGGGLAGDKKGAIAVKVARENHDLRFDLPCIGPRTLQVCREAGIFVLGVESGKTLLLEREQLEAEARHLKVAVTALPE